MRTEHHVRALAGTPLVPIDDLLHDGALSCVYQPLIDLDSGAAVGHEALLRGPAGSPWESPLVLLDAARAVGRLSDLERCSLQAALHDATRLPPRGSRTLFVNIEPSTLTGHLDVVVEALSRRDSTQVVVEITERALAADPAGVLAGAERLRAAGCAIALDDVGVEPESLAFIPLLRPEVVKLDLALLRSIEDPATLTVAGAVRAYAEASGAEVVAEGIETPEDLTRALVLGATLGQGWLWGRPARAFTQTADARPRFVPHPVRGGSRTEPSTLVAGRTDLRRAPKHLLLPLSHSLELVARQSRVPPVLLACFQDSRYFTRATAGRYSALAASLPFVGALGVGMPRVPVVGVHGTSLAADDPLAREWTVVVLGAHESVALIAREAGPGRPPAGLGTADDRAREFDFVVTHDHALVTAAAQSLVGRLTAG
ncbi:EAL domain-containing protein [Actinotalea sp. K2]|uniref:sensor domain-containing phosphodiesterase n=1 Tax=Actinotalea sp. K2 TaxID=2939438 RepID=UPI00201719CB|nr:EAL domain-containing protein [Actinotalea sp. K2]MCL3862377.1 EAL domain-containing protein [Actinotalea sp. K2]